MTFKGWQGVGIVAQPAGGGEHCVHGGGLRLRKSAAIICCIAHTGRNMEKTLPLLDRRTIRMRWGDMDAVGHLNNTYYFRHMEQIRVAWLDSIGHPIDPAGLGPL